MRHCCHPFETDAATFLLTSPSLVFPRYVKFAFFSFFPEKIKVEVKPHSLSLQYEDNANISCSALGKTKLKWYKVGADVNNILEVNSNKLIVDDHYDTDGGSRYYHSRLILTIKDATKADRGKFKCVAMANSKIEDWATVSVRGNQTTL